MLHTFSTCLSTTALRQTGFNIRLDCNAVARIRGIRNMGHLIYVFDTRNLSVTKSNLIFIMCVWVLSTIGNKHANALRL